MARCGRVRRARCRRRRRVLHLVELERHQRPPRGTVDPSALQAARAPRRPGRAPHHRGRASRARQRPGTREPAARRAAAVRGRQDYKRRLHSGPRGAGQEQDRKEGAKPAQANRRRRIDLGRRHKLERQKRDAALLDAGSGRFRRQIHRKVSASNRDPRTAFRVLERPEADFWLAYPISVGRTHLRSVRILRRL